MPPSDQQNEEQVVGYAAADREPLLANGSVSEQDVVYLIQSLVIRSDLRNQGLGRQLMQEMEKTLLTAHPATRSLRLLLQAAADDSRLQRFYANLGYTPVDDKEHAPPVVRVVDAAAAVAPAGPPLQPSPPPPPPPPPPPLPPPTSPATGVGRDRVTLHKVVTRVCCQAALLEGT